MDTVTLQQENALLRRLIEVLVHDAKSPLTAIAGNAELLEQRALTEPDAECALRTIRAAAARLTKLANDTLSLARVEYGELHISAESLDLGEMIASVAGVFASQRRIDVDVTTCDVRVTGDAMHLRQVFENVIGNAVKYSPGGEPVLVRMMRERTWVLTSVRDRGIGIPRDELAAIFDRFVRASNAQKSPIRGTGLGLYLAKTIVELHGGRLTAESELGKGSAFTIALPAAPLS